ncbi:hypothetical protein BDF14DRAFT_789988 [Spinellus fusiger]|nr:hypothetical protein BDF14DRAFT_789988 [Spinellus fusiger]
MALVKEHGLLEQTKDMHQALVYYTKAAEQDHTEAMLDLIRIYSSPPIQPDMALKWCHCASEKGVEKADYLLGVYYEEGFDQITPDYPRALSYFTKAASKGYLPAEERLNRPLGEVEKRPQRHQCFVM